METNQRTVRFLFTKENEDLKCCFQNIMDKYIDNLLPYTIGEDTYIELQEAVDAAGYADKFDINPLFDDTNGISKSFAYPTSTNTTAIISGGQITIEFASPFHAMSWYVFRDAFTHCTDIVRGYEKAETKTVYSYLPSISFNISNNSISNLGCLQNIILKDDAFFKYVVQFICGEVNAFFIADFLVNTFFGMSNKLYKNMISLKNEHKYTYHMIKFDEGFIKIS